MLKGGPSLIPWVFEAKGTGHEVGMEKGVKARREPGDYWTLFIDFGV
jgi:hypothetical protein